MKASLSALSAILFTVLLGGCSNYFSNYRTVYRIETTTGERYYSDDEPDLNDSQGVYYLEDLDGNTYRIEKAQMYKIEKFKHRK